MTEKTTAISPLVRKLDELEARLTALQQQLNDPAVLANPTQLVAISKESGQLEPVVTRYRAYKHAQSQLDQLHELINAPDREMAELAQSELAEAQAGAATLMEELKDQFVAAEDNAVDSFFLEIRAGTGGEEAALFARDLFEMYRKYAEHHRWQFLTSDFSPSDRGGFKEVIVNVKGDGAYRHLQFEGGGHRVQRVPETEAQGRIHTSAATVAVLPEMPDVQIHIDPKERRRRWLPRRRSRWTKRQQGRNRLAPAAQAHRPAVQDDRAQVPGPEQGARLGPLAPRSMNASEAQQHAAQTSARRAMMGSGDRSQRIRTYNFPQNRCTDHRLGGAPAAGNGGGEKNFNLDQIIQGNLDSLIDALLELDKQQRLEAL